MAMKWRVALVGLWALIGLLACEQGEKNSELCDKGPGEVAPAAPPSEKPPERVAPSSEKPPEKVAPSSEKPGCTMESIRAAVQTRKGALTACYTEAAKDDPSLGGRIALQLGIEPGGKLVQRGIAENELTEAVAACMLKSLRGLHFPGAFEKPCGIVYPLVFSSSMKPAPKGTPGPR